MGRQKEFDSAKALEKAMKLFWKKGYDNVSLKDLLSEMQILNGSFYNTFGSKKEVFFESLKFYRDTVVKERLTALKGQKTLKQGLEVYFSMLFEAFSDKQAPNGCLLLNMISSFEESNAKDVSKFIETEFNKLKVFFTDLVRQAQASGEVRADKSAEVLALFIMTHIKGMMSLNSIGLSDLDMKEQIGVLIRSVVS